MRLIFVPKHQRLVNQCYPTGRTPDKKPKSSETSYLLYYVNSRRSKLQKVSSYLLKRSRSDISRRKIGNISVTLDLMNKIINSCKENLNVFINDFFNIMINVLSNNNFNNDSSIVELLEACFGSICSNVDATLLNSDPAFVKYYSSFIELFFNIVDNKIHNDDLLVELCMDISVTTNLASNPKLNHFINKAVTFTIVKFQERNPRYKAYSLEPQIKSTLTRRLSRTQTRMIGLDNAMDIIESDSTVKVLQSFFNTTETDKLNLSLRSLLACQQKTPNKELLEFVCNGIPVQLRYIVILLLIRQLKETATKTEHDIIDPIISLKLISSLLESDVSLVGLSVLDIMKKLLNFQLENFRNVDIVYECRVAIRNLSHKNYYKGQTSDILYELLVGLKSFEIAGQKHMEGREDENQVKLQILSTDINEIIKFKSEPSIDLELFIEMCPFLKENVIALFNIVDNQSPGPFIITKLFSSISQIESETLQKNLMDKVFEKYGKYALLSGLNYFLETSKVPSYVYYLYHMESAKFLNLNDYASQTQYKREAGALFTKDDLLNYYSDPGSNKYSKKGADVLLSRKDLGSTTDLISDSQLRSTSYDANSATTVSNSFNGDALNINKNHQVPELPRNKGSIYRFVSDDIRSFNTMRTTTPKITDLKNAIAGKSRGNKSKSNSRSLRGSQSVKSRVTDITFLLSELKSTHLDEEVGKIRDPDEEDIVGLDKIDVARSQSTKIKARKGQRASLAANDLIELYEGEEDNFEDATQDIEVMPSRGKIFSST
ncbi:hypothetical protein KAFR_0B03220 [Kazachstania africana CBS 2517]|uniref:Protein EFR3 n=1 Tax=Kazachstania africana (strain ATCC 22294 / BCRC 22015 / CBS 2517 / CECT 1963 / NBRC 1671 / NRRL Y-8276) TaxID=1071382 RepID=H2AQG8_KAZAF|nr:hypothetical protein KAFR_0B03220 [Kazachstania africana CBS 2517]CCF56618.1 hypothetical protein KAFR_0B03220 [Kazachstania africana CBS 2517]